MKVVGARPSVDFATHAEVAAVGGGGTYYGQQRPNVELLIDGTNYLAKSLSNHMTRATNMYLLGTNYFNFFVK